MNNILIVTVLALGLAVAQNSIAGQENDSGIVDFDYTGSVVETNVMTDESAGVGIIPHQEGYDGLPITRQRSDRTYAGATSDQEGYDGLSIQEPDMNKSRPGRSTWSYLY